MKYKKLKTQNELGVGSMKRVYNITNRSNEIDFTNLYDVPNVLGKFIIKSEYHHINDLWNGIHQADLEGYVVAKENNRVVAYKIVGFDEERKIIMDFSYNLNMDSTLKTALEEYCEGFNPFTNKKLTKSELEQIFN